MKAGLVVSNQVLPLAEDLIVVNVNTNIATNASTVFSVTTWTMPFTGSLFADFLARVDWTGRGQQWSSASLQPSTPGPSSTSSEFYVQGPNVWEDQPFTGTWNSLTAGTVVTIKVVVTVGNGGYVNVAYIGGTLRALRTA